MMISIWINESFRMKDNIYAGKLTNYRETLI
jgi:hypothetical protein